ncbi:MAG: ABC transporter substrate-binding protein [archaeon]
MDKKILLAVLLVAVIAVSSVAAYTVLSEEPETTDPEPNEPEPNEQEPTEPETQEITDQYGRTLTVPWNIERIIPVNAGTIRTLTYMDASELICAVEDLYTDPASADKRPYDAAHPEYRSLPIVGPSHGGEPELIAAQNPDVVFKCDSEIGNLDALQEQIGIPVIGLNIGTLDSSEDRQLYYEALTLIGQVLHKEDRATELIDYVEQCVTDLDSRTKGIPDSEKPTVYAGGISHRGSHGITSTRAGFTPFELTNSKNVITLDMTDGIPDTVTIDAEIIPGLNPDMIFCDYNGLDLIIEDIQNHMDIYGDLAAIQNNQTYAFWPQSSYAQNNELLLIDCYYIGATIYPDYFADIALSEKANEIFNVFLGQDLFDQMEQNLGDLGYVNIMP